MNAEKAKQASALMLKTGKKNIKIDSKEMQRVKEAITKEDIRALIKEGIIQKKKIKAQSRGRARILAAKKSKGRKKGHGKRKGTRKARTESKKRWISRVRSQRKKLKELKEKNPEKVQKIGYHKLYVMVKGNYFRGKKYLEKFVLGDKK